MRLSEQGKLFGLMGRIMIKVSAYQLTTYACNTYSLITFRTLLNSSLMKLVGVHIFIVLVGPQLKIYFSRVHINIYN